MFQFQYVFIVCCPDDTASESGTGLSLIGPTQVNARKSYVYRAEGSLQTRIVNLLGAIAGSKDVCAVSREVPDH